MKFLIIFLIVIKCAQYQTKTKKMSQNPREYVESILLSRKISVSKKVPRMFESGKLELPVCIQNLICTANFNR